MSKQNTDGASSARTARWHRHATGDLASEAPAALLAACPKHSDGSLSQLIAGGRERRLHRPADLSGLHPGEKRVGLAIEGIESRVRAARASIDRLGAA
jgi:hypothetical protein